MSKPLPITRTTEYRDLPKPVEKHEVVEFPADHVVRKPTPVTDFPARKESAEEIRDHGFWKLAKDCYQSETPAAQRDANLAELRDAAREYPIAKQALDHAEDILKYLDSCRANGHKIVEDKPVREVVQQQQRQHTVVQQYQQRTHRSDLSY